MLEIINKAVPKALGEAPVNAPVPWSENGNDYDQVREDLPKLL